MSIQAIIYARFSPRPNVEESLSAEKQETICRAYCERREYEVAEVYTDKGKSGSSADREGLWAAIEALRRGMVLVVRWRHRLARDVFLAETIRRCVEKAGARIEAAEESNNSDSPDDVFIQQVLAAFAQRERKITALRTKYAMLRHQKNGRIMSRFLPYGFKRDRQNKGKMVENVAEQEILTRICGLRDQGRSYREIARVLNDKQIPPRKAEGWSHTVVRAILLRG